LETSALLSEYDAMSALPAASAAIAPAPVARSMRYELSSATSVHARSTRPLSTAVAVSPAGCAGGALGGGSGGGAGASPAAAQRAAVNADVTTAPTGVVARALVR
jgi:hypothetical protein